MKQKLLKMTRSLLVAASLCAGVTSAWGEDVTETYALTTTSLKTITLDGDVISQAEGGTDVTIISTTGQNTAERVALGSGWSLNKERILHTSWDGYFSVCDLKAGDLVKLTFSNADTNGGARNYAFVLSGNVTKTDGTALDEDATYGPYMESGVSYKITKEGHLDLRKRSRNFQWSGLEIVTEAPTVTRPSIASAAGVGYTSLTITPGFIRGNGTGTVVTKYSYSNDVKTNGTEYTEVLKPTKAGTIYAYSYIDGGNESGVVSLTYEVVAPKLNTPTATFSSLSESNGLYYKEFNLDTDVSNIDGDVTVKYKYSTDKESWNDIDGASFVCTTGIAYVKATAENCDDSELIEISSISYAKTMDVDFSKGLTSDYFSKDNTILYKILKGFYFAASGQGYGTSNGLGTGGTQGYSLSMSVSDAIEGQVVYASNTNGDTGAETTGDWIFYENNNKLTVSRARSSNGRRNRIRTYQIYTPADKVATASNITIAETTDLSGLVLTHANVASVKAALTASVKTVKLGQIAFDVTTADLVSLTEGLNRNTVFVQLPADNWFEGIEATNLRTNDGVVALYALTDGQDYAASNDFIATAATSSRSYTENIVNTICLPFAIDNTDGSLGKFYTLEDEQEGGSTVKFKTVTTTEANKPYLFVPAATGALTLGENTVFAAAGAETTTAGDFSLVGVQEAQSIVSDGTATIYGFKTDGTLLKLTAATTIKGMRAYLKVTGASKSRSLVASFADETTGINSVEDAQKTSNGYYNLNGQRISQPTKGLYIVNGKKTIVK